MSAPITRLWTGEITSPLLVNSGDNANQLTLLVSSGTCKVKGSVGFKGLPAADITLTEGQTFTVSGSGNSTIDGVLLTPTGTTIVVVNL